MKTTEPPVVVEQTFPVTAETVWAALTEIDQMRQWYFENIPDFKPEVGFATEFNVNSGERIFPHLWRVTKAEPMQELVYDWHYRNYAGKAFVRFELFPEGDSTRLRVSCIVTEDFSDEIPEFQRKSCLGGWQYFIQQSLLDYLS